jgi:hypothetical protein
MELVPPYPPPITNEKHALMSTITKRTVTILPALLIKIPLLLE